MVKIYIFSEIPFCKSKFFFQMVITLSWWYLPLLWNILNPASYISSLIILNALILLSHILAFLQYHILTIVLRNANQ